MEKDSVVEQLAEAFVLAADRIGKKDVQAHVTGPGSLFGAGGVFSVSGLERDIITAQVRPFGLLEKLPRFASVLEQPRFGTITGITDDVGNEPAYPCDNAPSGYLKGCNLTAAFGRVARATNTIEFDKVMRQLHGGINTDLQLRGRMLGLEGLTPAGLSEADIVNIYTMSEMVSAGVRLERKLNVMTWQGSPANNNAGGGYAEFPGLDNQIATGQVDADTNQACPALDSDVKDFAYVQRRDDGPHPGDLDHRHAPGTVVRVEFLLAMPVQHEQVRDLRGRDFQRCDRWSRERGRAGCDAEREVHRHQRQSLCRGHRHRDLRAYQHQ